MDATKTTHSPLPCQDCDGDRGGCSLDGPNEEWHDCEGCCGEGIQACQLCDAHPSEFPAVAIIDGESMCAACLAAEKAVAA